MAHRFESQRPVLVEQALRVLDDLTPGRQADTVREFWLTDQRVVASEVQVSAAEAVIVATRIESVYVP